EVAHSGGSLKPGIEVPCRIDRGMAERSAHDTVLTRMTIQMDLDPRVPEQVRIHLQAGVAQDDAAKLLPERAVPLCAAVPARKECAVPGGGEAGQVSMTVLIDEAGGFARERNVDDMTILALVLLEHEV